MVKIQIILGSIREGRKGERVAKWLYEHASKRTDMSLEFIDLRDYPLPLFAHGGFPSAGDIAPEAKKWAGKIAEADGFIWVTPEYNHGYSSVLKNAIDHIYSEWKQKPVALVSYGGLAGGARAAEGLRLVAAELHMASIREAMVIPRVSGAFNDKGEPTDPAALAKSADTMLNDLLWWTTALKNARQVSSS